MRSILALVALFVPLLALAFLGLYVVDLSERVRRLEGVRIVAGAGQTMICKNVTQKIYYCAPIRQGPET